MTWADTSDLYDEFDYRPCTSIKKGIGNFIDWYKVYFKVPSEVL
jgi:UDP-glucuronate 4-epimerase